MKIYISLASNELSIYEYFSWTQIQIGKLIIHFNHKFISQPRYYIFDLEIFLLKLFKR